MNISNFISVMADPQDYTLQIVLSYIVIALVAAFIIFVILVNKGVLLSNTNNRFKRFLTHPLFVYSLRRIGSALFSIFIALAITFCLIRMQDLRTDYCMPLKSKYPTEEQFERFCDSYMESLGLSGSLIEQFFVYIYNIIPIPKVITYINSNVDMSSPYYKTYEFAIIYLGQVTPKSSNAEPLIWNMIINRMPTSFKWGAIATLLQILIGYPLGILMAKYQDKLIDKIGKTYVILVTAIPGLLYYYLIFTLFQQLDYSGLSIFPIEWDENNMITWFAPAIASAFAGISGISYWVRRYMLNEINSDYVKYARAKGLSENKIMFKHVLRNAIVPLSRSLSTAFISCLFGSYFIERLFSIPGFGDTLTTAINSKDFMIVQGVVVVSAVLSVISYLIADITMACMDPRISLTK